MATNGCAAAMRTVDQWYAHDHGGRVGDRLLVAIERLGDASVEAFAPGGPAPLAGLPGTVSLDTTHASATVRCERYVSIVGVAPPPIWDAVAGDYPAADGWIRLHTNYAQHRDPALAVLGVAPERDAVAAAVRR